MHRHTAHQSQRARICYRHHPFFDHDVEIIRSLRQSEPSVIIRLDDGLRIAIPNWMLDAVYCSSLSDLRTPRIAIHALCQLRELLDQQSLSEQPCDNSSGSSKSKGGKTMHKNFRSTTVRQATLQFEDKSVWARLPPSACNGCQALVAQLLIQTIRKLDEPTTQPRSEHERQD